MKSPTLAEQHEQAAEIAVEHFRECTILALQTMGEGLPQRYRKQAASVIKFFSEETTPAIWARLRTIPDPDSAPVDPLTGQPGMPTQSLADSWLASWERMSVAKEAT